MKIKFPTLAVCVAALGSSFAWGASAPIPSLPDSPAPVSIIFGEPALAGPVDAYSSSRLPDAPDALAIEALNESKVRLGLARNSHLRLETTPFTELAVGVTMGIEGIGFQVATNLGAKMNLRGGISFLNYSPNFTALDTRISGAIRFRTISAGVDLYPYHNSFHITPGFTFYNGNRVAASVSMVGGQTFDIEDTTYTSTAYDPITGTFAMTMGRKVAPSITVGFGNMLRRDSHWSIPTEIGFEYIGPPTATLNIRGTACDALDGCNQVQTDPATQANIVEEQAELNKDASLLRFYPLVSVGLSYRFGHNKDMSPWH